MDPSGSPTFHWKLLPSTAEVWPGRPARWAVAARQAVSAHSRGWVRRARVPSTHQMNLGFGLRLDTSSWALPWAACPSDSEELLCPRREQEGEGPECAKCRRFQAGVCSGEGRRANCWLHPTKTAGAAGKLTGWRQQRNPPQAPDSLRTSTRENDHSFYQINLMH